MGAPYAALLVAVIIMAIIVAVAVMRDKGRPNGEMSNGTFSYGSGRLTKGRATPPPTVEAFYTADVVAPATRPWAPYTGTVDDTTWGPTPWALRASPHDRPDFEDYTRGLP